MRALQDQIGDLKRGNQGQHVEQVATEQPFFVELLVVGLPSKFYLADMKSDEGTLTQQSTWKLTRAL